MIPIRIVNLFILYRFVCDTEAVVAEGSFLKSFGLLNGIVLASVCKYTHIPLFFSEEVCAPFDRWWADSFVWILLMTRQTNLTPDDDLAGRYNA